MNIEFTGDFFKKLEKINQRNFLRRMTNEIGILAVNFSKERFEYKNWIDKKGIERWQPRKRSNKRGSTLVVSGRLKRSLRKISTGDYYVFVGTDVPYAQIHNEGGEINKVVRVKGFQRKFTLRTRPTRRTRNPQQAGTRLVNVRSHNRKMNLKIPKRTFLGDSHFLQKKIERYITQQIDKELL